MSYFIFKFLQTNAKNIQQKHVHEEILLYHFLKREKAKENKKITKQKDESEKTKIYRKVSDAFIQLENIIDYLLHNKFTYLNISN